MIARIRYPKTTALLVALLAVVAMPFYAPYTASNGFLTIQGRVLYSNSDVTMLEKGEATALARMEEGIRTCSHQEFMYGWADLSQVRVEILQARWPGWSGVKPFWKEAAGVSRALFDKYEASCQMGPGVPIS